MMTFGFLMNLGGGEGGSGLFPESGALLALELPKAITPMVAGLSVGVFVGLVGIVAVLLLVGRGQRRPARRAPSAEQVVFIPPYGTMQRDTPLPPQAFATARPYSSQPHPQARTAHPARGFGAPLPFTPSTSLSARAFAKMGYDVDAEDSRIEMREERDAPNVDPHVSVSIEVDVDLDESDLAFSHTPVPPTPAVLVSPVVMLSGPPPAAAPSTPASAPTPRPAAGAPPPSTRPSHIAPRMAESGTVRAAESAPHPLGVIKSSSSAMRAASIADLDMDDSPTEIGETYFDEPPQPRRRTDPPKIRAIAPAPPRFSGSPAQPEPTPLLPHVTAPKVARRS